MFPFLLGFRCESRSQSGFFTSRGILFCVLDFECQMLYLEQALDTQLEGTIRAFLPRCDAVGVIAGAIPWDR